MRCDTTRRALLSRLFHLGRDSLSKLRKSITIFLARVSYHTIYGASWLQRTYIPPSSLLLSFFLSLLYPAARCFARWTRNIISVHTRMVSRSARFDRASRSLGSVWSFRKLRTMSSRTYTLHWARIASGTLFRHRVAEHDVSEMRRIISREGWVKTDKIDRSTRRVEITM